MRTLLAVLVALLASAASVAAQSVPSGGGGGSGSGSGVSPTSCNSGQVVTGLTDATGAVACSAPPAAGSTTQVQINTSGSLAGHSGMTYNTSTSILTVQGGIDVPGASGYVELAGGTCDVSAAGTGRICVNSSYQLTFSSDGGAVTVVGSGGSGTPGGSDTQVQFNDSSSFGGDAGLTYNKTTNQLTITGGGLTTDHVASGTTVASAGSIRIGNTNTIRARNAANDGDLIILTTTASNETTIGQVSGNTITPAGAGTLRAQIGGRICAPPTANLPTTGTIEEVLYTCAIPANTLSANGKSIRMTVTFITAANTNTKIPKIRFGTSGSGLTGTACDGNISFSSSAAKGSLVCLITRQGAGDQVFSSWTTRTTDNLTFLIEGDMARDETTALELVVTGTTATASGDLSIRNVVTEFLN